MILRSSLGLLALTLACAGNTLPRSLAEQSGDVYFCLRATLELPTGPTVLSAMHRGGRPVAVLTRPLPAPNAHGGWRFRGDTLAITFPQDSLWTDLIPVSGTDSLDGVFGSSTGGQVTEFRVRREYCGTN
jgi:hypothetical protein